MAGLIFYSELSLPETWKVWRGGSKVSSVWDEV